jgi:hypothetical protein
MPIIKDVEMWWVKLDPKRPAPAFGDSGPKWEFQARLTKAQAAELKLLNIVAKPVINTETDAVDYYKYSFNKKTHKSDGSDQGPVRVVDGKLNLVDPNTIGNGSKANIRVFQYDYEVKAKDGKGGKKGIATMLMEVQLTKLVKYVPKPRDDEFEETETEVVDVGDNQTPDPQDELTDDNPAKGAAPVQADPNF